MTTPRRVVVTGLGVVSALGTGYLAHSSGLKEGAQGIKPVQRIVVKQFHRGNPARGRRRNRHVNRLQK